MSLMLIVLGGLVAALFVYLAVALIKPEIFP